MYFFFFFSGYGAHRDLHVLPHSFPTRRSSDLGFALTLEVLIAAHVHVAAGKKRQRACSGGAKADLARPVRGRTIALAGLRPFDQGDGKNVADTGSACAPGQRTLAKGSQNGGAIGPPPLRRRGWGRTWAQLR